MRPLILISALFSFLAPAAAHGAIVQPLGTHPYALLQLDHGSAPRTDTVLRASGARLLSPTLRVWRVRSAVARRLAPSLSRSGDLEVLTPDLPLEPMNHITSGDPLVEFQWWLPVVGADRLEPPGPGRPLVVIDGGLDLSHPEFAGRPATSALNEQTVSPDEFHGTAVASVAAAPANGVGLVGVYPQADLRTWDASLGADLSTSGMIVGIDTGSRSCPGVLNLSVGTDRSHPVIEEVVQLAVERGCVIVAASGNSRTRGSPPVFPASLPHVLTIGSIGPSGSVSSFSNASPALDLVAPGEDMVAAATFESGYGLFSGTSFSAPLVAGATAWVWTVRGPLDHTQVFDLMRLSARDLGPAGRDPDAGFGVLDIPTALTTPVPPVDPSEPNEDVSLVKPSAIRPAGRPVLLGRQRLSARIDVTEDPRDVYRIFVPAQRTLTVSVAGQRNVNLRLWRGSTASVLETGAERRLHLIRGSARAGTAIDFVRFPNRGRGGLYLFAEVIPGPDVSADSYSLNVSTARR